MKASDRTIVVGAGVFLLTVLFYFMILAPKRERAAELSDEITSLESSIDEQEQLAAFGEQARQQFPVYYGRLVVLGKAVPERADTSSMLVQLNSIASRKGIDFRGIALAQGGSSAGTGSSTASAQPAAAAAASTATPTATGVEGATTTGSTTTGSTDSGTTAAATSTGSSAVPTPAPATEATAASLPIGAVVGPAGLPTLPYEISFMGGFFDVAGYFGGLDGLVQMREGSGQVSVDGRLVTIDGFGLKGGDPGGDPLLKGSLKVTSYVVPAAQGLTAGATPGGPAPAAPVAPTSPASAVTP